MLSPQVSSPRLPSMMRLGLMTSVVLTVALAATTGLATDPTMADCLAASETSIKLQKDHHLREAREQLLICAALSCPAEMRAECERRVANVNADTPTVVFEVKDGAGNDLSNVTVRVDGKPSSDPLEGTALSLDPGPHQFHFGAAGQLPVDVTLVLREGEKGRRERVVIGTPPVVPVAAPPVTGSPSPEKQEAPQADHGRRVFGLVMGGTGVVGLGLGGVFGGLAASAWSTAKSECPLHVNCSTQALSDHDKASTLATTSTVGLIVGGALLAGGVIVFATAPSGDSPTVGLQATAGGLALSGRF
jgi:hypothetical protein